MNNKRRNSSNLENSVELIKKMPSSTVGNIYQDSNNRKRDDHYRFVKSFTIYQKVILNVRGIRYEIYLNSFKSIFRLS